MKPKNALPSKRRGFVILFFIMSSIVILPVVGLSIDVVLMYFIKARLVSAADAGALAGARSLARGGNFATQKANAEATAAKFFRAGFPNGALLSSPSGPTLNVLVEEMEDRSRRVTVEANVNARVMFLGVLGINSANANVRVIGQTTRRDVNIMMVVDRTGSLQTAGVCGTVKAAVIDFVNFFSEGRDLVGLATFAQSSRADVPLTNINFKQKVQNVMANVTCTGYTGGAWGLEVGHQQLKDLNDPGVLNVVLFFTDGIPNTVRAAWPIKKQPFYTSTTDSNCSDKSDRTGSITESPTGILKADATGSPGATDPSGVVGPTSGCDYASNNSNVGLDVSFIPDKDAYGTNLASGWAGAITRNGTSHASYNYPPVGRKLQFSGSNIRRAAQNGVDNAALDIKNNPNLSTVIYAIGFGADVQDELLMKVANDPRSAFYDSSKHTGLYLFAPTKDAIKEAFRRVSSEILRISM